MTKKAILFGSIGTIVETSELQREAFNRAFKEAGLDWEWQPEEYRKLLTKSGGRQRIADYAENRGEAVDADALHSRKTEIFDDKMVEQGLSLRPGVSKVISQAKKNGVKLGFVTATSRANVVAIFDALGEQIDAGDFDFVGDVSMVSSGKPQPDIYKLAIRELGVAASECIAIEDTPISAQAAHAAGIMTIAFPGAFADQNGFSTDTDVVTALSFQRLVGSD